MKPIAISLLTVCGIAELAEHEARKVTHALSIIDPDEPDPAAFLRYAPHHRTVLRFHDAIEPAPGVVLPEASHVAEILAFGRDLAASAGDRQDGHLLVHCHAGISRSTAALTMLLAQLYPDQSADALLARVLDMRPKAWPNLRMIEFADEQLERRGELVRAAGRIYRHQVQIRDHIADFMRRHGRGREVDMAERS
jgi:predicted protein tyrosine phosphatase